jgi:hypothetical protein
LRAILQDQNFLLSQIHAISRGNKFGPLTLDRMIYITYTEKQSQLLFISDGS